MVLQLLRMIVAAACAAAACRHYVHMLQLESYQLPGYQRWLRKNREAIIKGPVLIGFAATALSWYMPVLLSVFITDGGSRDTVSQIVMIALFLAVAGWFFWKDRSRAEKKPLAFTDRLKRLYCAVAGICLLISALLTLLRVPAYLVYSGVAFIVYAAALIMQPVENHINQGFFDAAHKKLMERDNLIKIGITGSYGKTSTKFVLRDILSERYNVLATPASYNTPMGLSRVINEMLRPEHELFIAEMGARHVGDIKELCALVEPRYGLITSVGPQHLETFGSIENIAGTKNELIEALPEDGMAFFASDGGYVDRLYMRCTRQKFRSGFQSDRKLYMTISDVTAGPAGSSFVLECADGGRVTCKTKLLGTHNLSNIALAASCARALGLEMDEIARGIRRIQPVEHRLQLMPGPITVIDDAFNSNPTGAHEALKVLSGFPARRIIVTPGMVEQGEKEDELNYAFGAQMPGCVDIAILVGAKHTRPIYEGLTEAGFPEENIHVARDLDEATKLLGEIGAAGDTVLFENDLPDNYNE